MDRREAMKKIAVGGATVVGASAVISSPAFAFDQPVQTTAPTFNLTFSNSPVRGQATVTQALPGVGSCNASATGGTDPVGVITNFALVSFDVEPGSEVVIVSQTSTQFDVQKRDIVTLDPVLWLGSSGVFTATVRYTCTYAGGSASRDVVNTYSAGASGVTLIP